MPKFYQPTDNLKNNPIEIILTIDDAPSFLTASRIKKLKERQIPAVFFCRGDLLEKNMQAAVDAIKAGFLIANHSYTHPYYSRTSNEDFFTEITQTEDLIDECYRQAKVERPAKLIRLPFGDRGAGGDLKAPENQEECEKVEALQSFLKEKQFQSIDSYGQLNDDYVDAGWTWDTQDYKKSFWENPEKFRNFLQKTFEQKQENVNVQILLIHDSTIEEVSPLFDVILDFLFEKLDKKEIEFLPIKLIQSEYVQNNALKAPLSFN